MTQYLISFGAHAMDHIPDDAAAAVATAAHAVVQEAINAGVYVSAGGRRCGGLPRSPSPAAARRRSGRSGPTPDLDAMLRQAAAEPVA